MQSATTPKVAGINILSPSANDDRLLFRVFDNASPIGYARLKKTSTVRKRPDNVVDMFDPEGTSSYELKMIEIAQNYRHRGLGTTLLQEVIRFCRDSNIKRLTGEIKGDSSTLRHWYQSNGFLVSRDNRIELLPPVSC